MTSTAKWLQLLYNCSCWHGNSGSFHIALNCSYDTKLDGVCECDCFILWCACILYIQALFYVSCWYSFWEQIQRCVEAGNRRSGHSMKHLSKIWFFGCRRSADFSVAVVQFAILVYHFCMGFDGQGIEGLMGHWLLEMKYYTCEVFRLKGYS